MSKNNTIGVGVIGASPGPFSWAANTHIPALRALPGYEVRAVSTSRAESARAAESAYGVPAYDNASQLIAHRGVDLVVVAVKVTDHASLVSEALNAGKMVYSEWPLAVDLEQATRLAAEAAAAGVRTIIGLQGRYAPAVQHARHLIETGYVGELHSTTIVGSGVAWGPVTDRSHAYLYDDANGATTLTAAAMHALDAAAFVIGTPDRIRATMSIGQRDVSLGEDGSRILVTAPDQVAITAGVGNGAVLSVFYRGGVSRGDNLRWQLSGSEGELLITSTTPANGNLQAIDLLLQGARGAEARLQPLAIPGAATESASLPTGPAANVARLYQAFQRDVARNEQTVPDFAYALRQHQMVASIQSSARSAGQLEPASSDVPVLV
jgi:predicted dehydrogenase